MIDKMMMSLKTAYERCVIKHDGCWDWKGFLDKDGYGRVSSSYTKKLGAQTSHRASWLIYKGEIPKDKIIRHKCDNKQCTNPDHLELGTFKENSQDMIRKKRQAFGMKNGNSKLNEEDVKTIKKLLNNGKSYALIAELFDVHKDAIANIKLGHTWKHVEVDKANSL